jgi:hypothetical protein
MRHCRTARLWIRSGTSIRCSGGQTRGFLRVSDENAMKGLCCWVIFVGPLPVHLLLRVSRRPAYRGGDWIGVGRCLDSA